MCGSISACDSPHLFPACQDLRRRLSQAIHQIAWELAIFVRTYDCFINSMSALCNPASLVCCLQFIYMNWMIVAWMLHNTTIVSKTMHQSIIFGFSFLALIFALMFETNKVISSSRLTNSLHIINCTERDVCNCFKFLHPTDNTFCQNMWLWTAMVLNISRKNAQDCWPHTTLLLMHFTYLKVFQK